MIAMHEAAVFVDQGSRSTVEQRGALPIYIPSRGYESVSMKVKPRLDSLLKVGRIKLNVFQASQFFFFYLIILFFSAWKKDMKSPENNP